MPGTRIGFIGLGALGTPIAENLVTYAKENGLPPLTFWNRSKGKYEPIKAISPDATFAETPEEVAGSCDVIITVLLNDAVAEEVYEKLRQGAKGSGVVCADMSTLLPEVSKKLEKLAKEHNITYLTCNVFGQPVAAKARGLTCLMAGDAKGRETVKPILSYIGKHVIDVGERVEQSSQIKLLGNMTLLSSIQVLGEVYTLAEKIGVDPHKLFEAHKCFIPAPSLMVYANKISNGTFGGPGFETKTGLKDASHMQELRGENPFPLPVFETAVKNLKKSAADGNDALDWSTLSLATREAAGLSKWKEGTDDGKKAPPPLKL